MRRRKHAPQPGAVMRSAAVHIVRGVGLLACSVVPTACIAYAVGSAGSASLGAQPRVWAPPSTALPEPEQAPLPPPAVAGASGNQGATAWPAPAHGGLASQAGGLAQRIGVTVRPGGPLDVQPQSLSVPLRRAGAELLGEIGSIHVVDPRGTLGGWRLRLTAGAGAPSRVLVVPGPARAVSGIQQEVRPGKSRDLRHGGSVVLMSARPGGGGGEFETSVEVALRAGPRPPSSLLIRLEAG